MAKVAGSNPALRTIFEAINKGMNENHEAAYRRLLERLDDMTEVALKRDYSIILVILPHHDFRKDFSAQTREAFLDFGFAVDRWTTTGVYGDEFEVNISAISTFAGRGKAIHIVYLPKPEGLSPQQVKDLEDWKKTHLPVLMMGGPNHETYEY